MTWEKISHFKIESFRKGMHMYTTIDDKALELTKSLIIKIVEDTYTEGSAREKLNKILADEELWDAMNTEVYRRIAKFAHNILQ